MLAIGNSYLSKRIEDITDIEDIKSNASELRSSDKSSSEVKSSSIKSKKPSRKGRTYRERSNKHKKHAKLATSADIYGDEVYKGVTLPTKFVSPEILEQIKKNIDKTPENERKGFSWGYFDPRVSKGNVQGFGNEQGPFSGGAGRYKRRLTKKSKRSKRRMTNRRR